MRLALNIIGALVTLSAAGFLFMAVETGRYWNERNK